MNVSVLPAFVSARPVLSSSSVPLPGRLHHILLQPGGGQSPSGPEEAREARGALPAFMSGVFVQQEVGLVELPGPPSESPGQIPSVVEGDPEVHAPGAPGRGNYTRGCELSYSDLPQR